MAEGFARAIGRDRVEAYSAGSRPSGAWDYIVTMGCGDACPNLPAHHRIDWDLPDPKPLDDAGFRNVRDQIARRVAALLADARQP